ncbi:MAG: type IV toxin-antitoxin system AbiEi family antitoxin domain-containing protein [Clostridiales Family XIII bacterium]|jgi:predicted transcriptional regulator of viral defense system|nr:type IV toxin-antitoxin system AbiEi family antitoxin domain-containing protein [Clostridiales Family XIII bacterium]
MNELEKIKEILFNKNGIVTASDVTGAGIPRRCLADMVQIGLLHKAARGIYISNDAWEDELYFFQYRYTRGVYSHETALYLHRYSDRTPAVYTMTFPSGYNVRSIRKDAIIVRHTEKKYYEIGIAEILTMAGNPLRVYDIERTLCDIVQTKSRCDAQIVAPAMKQYALSKEKNIPKLMSYAAALRVENRVRGFMEVLL